MTAGAVLGAFLILQGLLCGVFSAIDAVVFYVFFEATLIPMFMIIGVWGGPNRMYATLKFFLYTFLGSILMLIALLYLYNQTGSFEIQQFYALNLRLPIQELLFYLPATQAKLILTYGISLSNLAA